MQSFYVRCVPMPLIVGGSSHGTHVFAATPERATQVAVELGYTPIETRLCPGTFTCACVQLATVTNQLAAL